MPGEMVFTPGELVKLNKLTLHKAMEALDAGNIEQARKMILELEKEHRRYIYTFEEWVAILLSFVGRNFGHEKLEQALRSIAETYFKPIHDASMKTDYKTMVEGFAAAMRTHTGTGFVKVTEDEEKVTFELNPCGSGMRMIRAGYYGPPKNLYKVKGPHPLTFGRQEMPVYCSHCTVLHQIGPIEWAGAPYPVINPPEDPTKESCFMLFYKDPADVPPEVFSRVGKTKKAK